MLADAGSRAPFLGSRTAKIGGGDTLDRFSYLFSNAKKRRERFGRQPDDRVGNPLDEDVIYVEDTAHDRSNTLI